MKSLHRKYFPYLVNLFNSGIVSNSNPHQNKKVLGKINIPPSLPFKIGPIFNSFELFLTVFLVQQIGTNEQKIV